MPHRFLPGAEDSHRLWLKTLYKFDGVLCISRTVANDIEESLQFIQPKRSHPFKIGWFHLGADLKNSVPTYGRPKNAREVLQKLSEHPTFLIVSTIEPRKGYIQTLNAFELLWQKKISANLVIVGNHGWMMDEFIIRLNSHSELGNRLFWLNKISDEFLEDIYAVSTCLISPSEGEGFGLPLIEAAYYKLPMIVRDISVFHEVAGDYAVYFSGMRPEDIANVIERWLSDDALRNQHRNKSIPWLTWKQSTQQLLDNLIGNKWYKYWMPENKHSSHSKAVFDLATTES